MEKQKIVHIIPSLMKGGSERFVVDLCNELSEKESADIHLISLYKNDIGTTFEKDISNKVFYHHLDKRSGFDKAIVFALDHLLKQIGPSVIHTHLNALEYAVYYKLKHPRTPFFHTIHNDAFKECDIAAFRKLRRVFYKTGMIKPVTISAESAASYHACYRLQNDTVIENGRVPIGKTDDFASVQARYGIEPDVKVLVNVGRICIQKNQRLLVDAVNAIVAEGTQKVRLLIIGEEQDKEIYEQLKSIAGPGVSFLGGQNNVSDYLLIADVFCLSSEYEGMPISLIEAFSVGCIPVCTPVGGMKEMIRDGENGFLSKDLSVEAYKNALEKCLVSDSRQQIREAGKEEFKQKYHIAITAAKYQNLYGR